MNVNFYSGKYTVVKLFAVVFFVFSFSLNSFPGDLYPFSTNIGQVVFNNYTKPVLGYAYNNGEGAVNNLQTTTTIMYETSPEEFIIIYQESTTVEQLPANEQIEIKFPDITWEYTGLYYLNFEITSPDDTDNSNNVLAYYFSAVGSDFLDFEQLNFQEPAEINNSTTGSLTFSIEPIPEPIFINVMAKHTVTGNPVSIVNNFPALPSDIPYQLSTIFNLERLGLTDGQEIENLDIAIRFDQSQLTDGFIPNEYFIFPVSDFEYNSSNDLEPLFTEEYAIINGFEYNEEIIEDYVYYGSSFPKFDLNGELEPDFINSLYTGAVAAGNGFQFLEESFPFIPTTGLSPKERIEQIQDIAAKTTNQNSTSEQLIAGKLGHIDNLYIPTRVNYHDYKIKNNEISSPDNNFGNVAKSQNHYKQWEFIKTKLKENASVEIQIMEPSNRIIFSRFIKVETIFKSKWVSVTGYTESGETKKLIIQEDWDKQRAGGVRERVILVDEDFEDVDNDGVEESILKFRNDNVYVGEASFIQAIVSQSYDPNIRFDPTHDEQINIFSTNHESQSRNGPAIERNTALLMFDHQQLADYAFLNARVMTNGLPQNAAILKRAALNQRDSTWIIRNVVLPAGTHPGELGIWSNMNAFLPDTFAFSDSITFDFSVDSAYITSGDFETDYTIDLPIQVNNYNPGFGGNIEAELSNKFIDKPDNFSWKPVTEEAKVILQYRGNDVAVIDLDSSLYNPETIAGYAGDKYADGPAAVSNALQWLEETSEHVDSTYTHREKMQKLSTLMDRDENNTVTNKSLVSGILEYIDDEKLLVNVTIQGFPFDTAAVKSPNPDYGHVAWNRNDTAGMPVQWEWLMDAMDNNKAVAMGIGYYNSIGKQAGQWLTLTGLSEVGGYKGIYFKNDLMQDMAGGIVEQFAYWETSPGGYPYLPQLSDDDIKVFVETAVVLEEAPEKAFEVIDTVTNPTDILSSSPESKIKILDNPGKVHEDVVIQYNFSEPVALTVRVFDIQGREVLHMPEINVNNDTYLQTIPGTIFSVPGNYVIHIQTNNRIFSKRILKN